MASIATDKRGYRRILWVDGDGSRRAVRIGKAPMKMAQQFKTRIEHLQFAKASGTSPDLETARWLVGIDTRLVNRLAAHGLCCPRESALLGSFLEVYISSRHDVKQSTLTVWGHTKRTLLEFFGADRPLSSITPGHADEWRLALAKTLADNTVRRRCGIAKQFFRAAVRKGLIDRNPFADLKSTVGGNQSREFFVTREMAACPDWQWRLLFALSRYGGLRCPSEHLALTWDDIDWARSRMLVRSPKTEHHVGGESRWVPIFPELRPYIDEAWAAAPKSSVYLITRYREATVNLRTHLLRIIRRAGLKPWPKLLHNLRATRETELAESFPMHVVCAWIGNSQLVAKEHYLQVTDAHFEAAVISGCDCRNLPERVETERPFKPDVAQKAAQQAAARSSTALDCAPTESANTREYCNSRALVGMEVGAEGLEPPTSTL